MYQFNVLSFIASGIIDYSIIEIFCVRLRLGYKCSNFKETLYFQKRSQRDGKYCLPNPENMDRNHRSQEHISTTNRFAVVSSLDTDDSST